jgi:Dictyostelium (slime mold) repeat
MGTAALLVAAASPALALHRDSPNATRLTRGASHTHPSTRSWGGFFAFSSTEDMLGTGGGAGRRIFVWNLQRWGCTIGTNNPTPCPSPLPPYLMEVAGPAGNPDNPTVAVSNTGDIIVAFDADGSFNGGTGAVGTHRQIFIKNLTTGVITNVTNDVAGADMGDSVKPSSNGFGGAFVFESTARLKGGGFTGIKQIFLFQTQGSTLTQITDGSAPSTAPMMVSQGVKFGFQSTANLDPNQQPATGANTGVSQIYWYDGGTSPNGTRLKKLTNGNASSQHPYISEKNGFLLFDSAATDLPLVGGGASGPGTQIYMAHFDDSPSIFVQMTPGPKPAACPDPWNAGNSTYPTVPDTLDRVAFISTGDLLCNGTSGNRLFIRQFKNGGGNIYVCPEDHCSVAQNDKPLIQVTGRGDVQGPISASLGQWFVSLATTDDMTGEGICGPQIHVVDFYDNPQHYPVASVPGQIPLEPPVGDPVGSCEDGNSCTTDTCNAGVCQRTTLPDSSACSASECFDAGICVGGFCNGAESCDDGDPCTDEICDIDAHCQHIEVSPCTPCSSDAQCDDGNPCTDDTCSAGRCSIVQRAEGADCSALCRVGDMCDAAGTCALSGTTIDCSDGDPCTLDVCASDGSCSNPLDPNADNCRDCTTAIPDCDDGNPCTNKACVSMKCHVTPKIGTCSDGNSCNGLETCSGGLCQAGTPMVCTPANACFTGTCVAGVGCQFDPIPGCVPCTSAADCSDGNACNGAERCTAGQCKPGTAPNCNDGLGCTLDACDPVVGCQHVADHAACNDGIACTTDVCSSTFGCLNNAIQSMCDDGNACTDDLCAAGAGCLHTNKPNGTRCGVGDGCTVFPTCEVGVCVGDLGPGTCSDTDECTIDTCAAGVGCQHADATGFPGIYCRLTQLEVLLANPPVKRSLAKMVSRAGRRVSRAETATVKGSVRHLGVAQRLLRRFVARLIRTQTKKLPKGRAVEVAQKARQVLTPVQQLRLNFATLGTADGTASSADQP